MRDNEERISKLGAQIATIGTGDLAYAREFREKYGIRFPVLVDDAVETYRLVEAGKRSLLGWASPKIIKASVLALQAGASQGRIGKHMDFLGATHILCPDTGLEYAWLNDDFSDDAPMDDVVRHLDFIQFRS